VTVKKTLVSLVSVLSVSLYPIFFMYFNNLGKVQIKEIVGITGVLVLLAAIFLTGAFLLVKNLAKAALITNIVMLFFLYFAFIEKAITKLLPMFYYWHVILICLFLIIHISYLIFKKINSTTAEKINRGLLVIFTGLIVYNGIVNIIPAINTAANDNQRVSQAQIASDNTVNDPTDTDLPNVYYFIFDEYAGYDGIQRYTGFDNIDFYNSLEELGFVTSKHSRNGSIDTYTEIPNLLQLQEINSVDMTSNEKKENLKNPYLLILMKNNGYSLNVLDSTNYHFIDNSFADFQFTSEFVSTFRTFNSYVIENTAYYPFYGTNDQDKEINVIEKMFSYTEESSGLKDSNLLTVGYFNFPHLPYIVDESGNKANQSVRSNLRDPVPYLAQFKYANKKILEMVNEIIEQDPDSIIILQSDHGFRLPSHLHYWYGMDDYDLQEEAQFEQNILNAVYYQGEEVEIEGLSGLNTLYVVLNKLLGIDFDSGR